MGIIADEGTYGTFVGNLIDGGAEKDYGIIEMRKNCTEVRHDKNSNM